MMERVNSRLLVDFPDGSIESSGFLSVSEVDVVGMACGPQPGLDTSGMPNKSLQRGDVQRQ